MWNPPVPSQSPAGYSTNIWVGATNGFETPTLYRTKHSLNTYPVQGNTLNFITLFRTKDKMHARTNSRYSHRSCQSTISERSRQHQIGEFFMSTPSAMYFLKKRVIFSAKCPVECCVFQFLLYKCPQR